MKKYFYIAFVATLFFSCNGENNKLKQHSKMDTIGVDVFVARAKNFREKYNVSGSLMANESVNLTTESSGKVQHIYFKEGQQVKKGMLLLTLDNSDLKAQLDKANLQANLLKKELDRKTKLLAINGISKEAYDQAESNYKSAEADRDLIAAQLSKTKIIAPFSGKIGLRNVSEGAFVNSNTVVASLQQLNPLKLQFSLPEEYAANLQKGAQVNFTLANNDSTYSAKIYAMEPDIDVDTRSIKIRALVDNNRRQLLPGAFAKVSVSFATIPNAILVPSDAVISALNKNSVLLYKNRKVKEQSIKVAYHTDAEVLVSSGIQPGDTIITTGLLILKNGMHVKIKK